DPVLSRQPRVEDAVRDIARHFLGADQHARDLGVVDSGEVGPGADVDVEAGTGEQLNRRVLQGAFRYPQFQLHLVLDTKDTEDTKANSYLRVITILRVLGVLRVYSTSERSKCVGPCGRHCLHRGASL